MSYRLLECGNDEPAILNLPFEIWDLNIMGEIYYPSGNRGSRPLIFRTCTVSKRWYDLLLKSVHVLDDNIIYCFQRQLLKNGPVLYTLINWSSFVSRLPNLKSVEIHDELCESTVRRMLTKILFYDNISSLSNIKSLQLSSVGNIINDMMLHLNHLSFLCLFDCSITNDSVRKLSNIASLTLLNCKCITYGVFDEMSHPLMECLEISLSWIDDVKALHVINSALYLTRLTSLSIDILGPEYEDEEEDEWNYELDRLQFMTNLTSLKLSTEEEHNDVLSIKDDKIFSSLTKLTNLSYRRDHSCNSDDSLMTLTNLKSLSIVTINDYHVTPSLIERLSHVNLFSFRCILNNAWQDVISYFSDNSSLYKEKLEGGRIISRIHNEVGWPIILVFVRICKS